MLCRIPPHDNIIRLYAFFYDRPMTHPKLRDNCGDGIALFMLLEELSQNMKEHIETLTSVAGPPVSSFVLI